MVKSEIKTSIFYGVFAIISLFILWKALSIFFLVFASILLATLLYTISSTLSRLLRIPYPVVLVAITIIAILLITLFFWIATPLITEQLSQLFEEIPAAYQKFKSFLARYVSGAFLKDETFLNTFVLKNSTFFSKATEIFSFTLGTITGFVVFLLVGLYLAFNPKLYVQGILALFPSRKRERVKQILNRLGHTLQWWLVGKMISMIVIGSLTLVGLWLLKMPLAFILAFLMTILTFIPYVGPIIASIPAILVGLAQSPLMGLYVVILYIIIHMIEGYGITPFIEQRTVYLPPALTVVVQIILSLLVGFLGLALASPITALFLALISTLLSEKNAKASAA